MNDLSFCKFNISQNIQKVIWEITNQCNYSCDYCIFSSTGKKPRGELSFDKVIDTLYQLKSYGFNYIKFTGGEPFIREDFIDILLVAKDLGFNFDISTNASFITETISKKISALSMNFIHVSLDGYNLDSHEFVRGKKSFNKTIIGLKNLLLYNKNIRLGCVIHSQNDNYLDKVVDLANTLHVKEIIFSLMSPIGRMDKNSSSLSQKRPQELIEIISNISSPFTQIKHNLQSDITPINFDSKLSEKVCPGGEQFLFIDSIGIVSPCTWVSESFPEFHLLSLHSQSLTNILQHNLFKKFNIEKQKLKGQCFALAYQKPQSFNQIYSFATENISYIDKLPLKNNQSALVITGSGDQAISLINLGFKDITCIDSNYLARFYMELKVVALEYLSYEEFIIFFKNNEKSLSYQSYKKISAFLTPECEKFWNQHYINNKYSGFKMRNSSLFNLKYDMWEQKLLNVPYLASESLFLKIKESISACSFKFVTEDFLEYSSFNKFDLILLSNISDYSHKIFANDYIKSFKTHFVEKSLSLLHREGTVMFSYVYDFDNIGNSSIRNKLNVGLIRKMYFQEFNYKEIIISSAIQNLKHDVICYIQK